MCKPTDADAMEPASIQGEGTPTENAPIQWDGRFRFYFNDKKDEPRVWSIDRGDPGFEVTVCRIVVVEPDSRQDDGSLFQPVLLRSSYDAYALWPNPNAWFEGRGHVEITIDGFVTITPTRGK